jgi:hypothetical protein
MANGYRKNVSLSRLKRLCTNQGWVEQRSPFLLPNGKIDTTRICLQDPCSLFPPTTHAWRGRTHRLIKWGSPLRRSFRQAVKVPEIMGLGRNIFLASGCHTGSGNPG